MNNKILFIFFGLITVALGLICLLLCPVKTVNSDELNTDKYYLYLKSFGWNISEYPIEISYEKIPDDFDEVWTEFNNIQLCQGFDLTPYKGKLVEKRVYKVYNYNDTDNEFVRADIFIYDGDIIGADIFSVAFDGFMHGVNEYTDGKNKNG